MAGPLPPYARILLVRLSSLGDILFTLPLLERLREAVPGARIEWAVEDRFAEVVAGHQLLDEIVVYPRRAWSRALGRPWLLPAAIGRLARHFLRLRMRRYDAVLDLQGNLKSALHVLAARAARRIGFAAGHTREAAHLFVSERVVPPPTALHRVDKFLSLLDPLGIPTDRPRWATGPPLDPGRLRWANEAIGPSREDQPVAFLHPATSEWGRDKQWPAERFAALATLLSRREGARVFVTWGPGERGRAEAVVHQSEDALLAPATRSLRDLAALLTRADLFVGCDTGVLHLACALGIPSVGLYGPTDPAVYGPVSARALVVRGPSAPGPRDRSRVSPAMLAIQVEEVFEACQRLLAARAGLPNATGKTAS